MTMILIHLFYLAVLALVIAAGVYLYRTRESVGEDTEPAQTVGEEEAAAGSAKSNS